MFAPAWLFDKEKLEAFCRKSELIVAEAKRDLNSTIVRRSGGSLYNEVTASGRYTYQVMLVFTIILTLIEKKNSHDMIREFVNLQ